MIVDSPAATAAPLRFTAGLVVYRTPLAELLPLFDLLQGEAGLVACGIFDNGDDPALRDEVVRRGWHYLTAHANLGFGAGHNRIFAVVGAQADTHLIVNPDVLWQDSPLPALLACLQQHPPLAAVAPDVFGVDGQRQYLAKRLPTPWLLFGRRFAAPLVMRHMARYELHDFTFAYQAVVPIISGCCMLCRSKAWRQVDGFDEGYFLYLEDYDLCRRWTAAGWQLGVDPAARIVHGHARSSYRWSRALLWHLSSAWRYFQRWGWRAGSAHRFGAEPLSPLR